MNLGPVRDMDTHWKKATGLMLRFPKQPYIFRFSFPKRRRIDVTMWFVFFPIDLAFVDNDQVVEIVHSLLPFQNYFPKKVATELYEFPAGSLHEFNITVGSVLEYDGRELHKKR